MVEAWGLDLREGGKVEVEKGSKFWNTFWTLPVD
jgi:hypothetical protein